MVRRDRAFERSIELHDRIETFYSRIEERRAFFRDHIDIDRSFRIPIGMERRPVRADPIVCALAIKAATTKRAIVTLRRTLDGDNALALTRVLLENACLIEWLIRDTDRLRIEAYVMFTSVMHGRIVRTVNRFRERFIAAGADPRVDPDPYHQAVAEHVFGNPRHNWPTWNFDRDTGLGRRAKVKEIFEEISGKGQDLSFEYEVLYGALGSDIVHSGPYSLSRPLQWLRNRATFMIDALPAEDGCTIAIAMSNVAMLLVLDAVNEYASLGLDDELATLKAEAQRKPETGEE